MNKSNFEKPKYEQQIGLEPKPKLNSSSQTIAKPIVKCNKTVRSAITRILYQNSTDDSECMRIKFEKIEKIIDDIMLCVA